MSQISEMERSVSITPVMISIVLIIAKENTLCSVRTVGFRFFIELEHVTIFINTVHLTILRFRLPTRFVSGMPQDL